MSSQFLFNTASAVTFLVIILSGVYYSITLTQNYDERPEAMKPLIVFIVMATILGSMAYLWNFVIPVLTAEFNKNVSRPTQASSVPVSSFAIPPPRPAPVSFTPAVQPSPPPTF